MRHWSPPLRLVAPLLLACVLLVVTAVSAAAGEATLDGGDRIRWDGGLDQVGARVVRRLPAVRAEVAAALGFPLRGGPAEIVIISGHERMRAECGHDVPDWAAGVCVGHKSRIVLRSDLVDRNPLSSMVTTLRHEWVHLAWSRRAGPNTRKLPLWFEEGLAEEVGGGVSVEAGAQLDFAARFGWLLDFEAITRTWPSEARDASLAYKQGRSWVRWFREKQGAAVLQRILADLADGKGYREGPGAGSHFEQLVFATTGSTLSRWIAMWRIHVEEEADPWFHLLWRDFWGTIFIVMAVLCGIGFFFLRRRRRLQIDALPDDPMPGHP